MDPIIYYVVSIVVLLCAGFHHTAANPVERDSRSVESVTPPPDTPQWTVKDDEQNICMLMAMNATLSAYPEDVSIPSYATVDDVSVCNSTAAKFRLTWGAYTFYITFQASGGSYRMQELGGSSVSFGGFSSWSYSSSDFQSASLGHCMTCHEEFVADQVTFHQYQFQPFAPESNSEYGQAEECSFGIPIVIILAVVVVLFVIAVGVGVCIGVVVFVKRRNGSGHTRFQ